MWKGRTDHQILNVLAMGAISFLLSCQSTQYQRKLTYGYLSLWTEAQQRCLPQYPEESLAQRHQGLAVADLEIGRDGIPLHVSVLQSPDALIGRSVERCARNWHMRPDESAAPGTRGGKLYFYFLISLEGGKVYLANDPAEKKALTDLRH